MPLHTTVGQLLVNSVLPEDMQDHSRSLDSKAITKLLQEVADKHPDKYAKVLQRLHVVGHQAALASGGMSFGLEHLSKAPAAKLLETDLRRKSKAIYADSRTTDEQKDKSLVEMLLAHHKPLEDSVMQESEAEGNPLFRQVASGAKGKAMNLKSLRGMDLLYVDHRDRPIPIPILRSYSQGLTPVEYFAGSFGTRKGLIDLKMATPDAGFLSKQLVQATHRLVVTGHDHPEWDGSLRGLPVEANDPDNVGALLAHDVGGYKRGTVLTPKILSDLDSKGSKRILVRSPATFGSPDGGIYASDVGIREKGRLPPRGDFVGIAAAQALSEPLAQAAISSKHSGGVVGAGKNVGGYKLINQFVQVPKTFQGGAAHSQADGRVQAVQPAPQGGTYVTVDGQRHYVGQGFEIKVKPGDTVEAGDVLSSGWPNPSEIVKHKGVGEGRRYFIDSMRQAYKDAGIGAHRRNIELVARGLIDHVRMSEPHDDYLPDDVVPYNRLEHSYRPREGHDVLAPQRAAGMYLERPVLHYSIGTKIRPSVVKNLQEFGVQNVLAHKEPPPFQPEMIRGMENLAHDPDWMTRFLGSYLQKNLLKGTYRGAISSEKGTSYVAPLARGQDFGRTGLTQGWKDLDGPGATPAPTVPMGGRDMRVQGPKMPWDTIKTSAVPAPAPAPQPPQPVKQPQQVKFTATIPEQPQAPAAPQPQGNVMGMVNSMRGMSPQQFAQFASGPGRPLMQAAGPAMGLPGLAMMMHYFTTRPGETDYNQVFKRPQPAQPPAAPPA